ncbi:M15 family metallopeptidase [Streptomyces sp. Je 1-332]|uniref:M15 family metallopeptidase n=1 Tax=Streptomyces sp. Je 1-332 TaxID=3231270 RepID=UPI003458BF35
MTYNEPARTAETADTSARRGRSTVFARRGRSAVIAALAIGGATLMGVVGCQASQSSSASASMSLGAASGVVPDGVTVFDDETPAVAELDPDLLAALRRAAKDAADDKVTFYVNSGWRSPEYQDQLLREAVSTYGSKEKAARWVATPDTSPHVSGDAIDIGHSAATAWLSARGAGYGLCQIYRNESWHYELRPEAVERGCPPMYADPTHDPRMQR